MKNLSFFFWILFFFSFSHYLNAQILNKEVLAEIITVEKTSEFVKYAGSVANLSRAEYSLQYELSVFRKNEKGETSKESEENRIVLGIGEKKILSTVSIGNSENKRIIILLIVYDLDKKPLGQARLVINDDSIENNKIIISRDSLEFYANTGNDQAVPQDGYSKQGLVIENSLTKMGRDFYSIFYSKYYLAEIKTDKDIIITETPGRGRVTRIQVEIAGNLIWQFFANPSLDFLKEQADVAFKRSLFHLQELEKTQNNFIKY